MNCKPPAKQRSLGGARRALDYRKGLSRRFQRCSQCHAEHELTAPVLYNIQGQHSNPQAALAPIMLGDTLLGFICRECLPTCALNIARLFPDQNGFPLVDHHGQLAKPPKCDDCGAALAFNADGSVACAACDWSVERVVDV